ncbi:zinc finger matrin-type protein [Tasmannia lanceolata]|uniref:zinc finger matrin-type protein n=1 Tax=Tasmannia lanceolata TaxID=3420 RepID=UPI004063D315
MISLVSPSPFSVNLILPRPCLRSRFTNPTSLDWAKKKSHVRKGRSRRKCRAELSHDAPFAFAIGACVLNSLIFPISSGSDDDNGGSSGGSAFDSTDARFAVMGIISFIPYFNWLSWVFAYLDTERRRYLVYSIVYLAPYLRTNLSLSSEDSWLPIASIVICIIHIQLEASIWNGDLKTNELFGEALKLLPLKTRNKDTHFQGHEGVPKKGRNKEEVELPSVQEESENKLPGWGVSKKPSDDSQHLNEGGHADENKKK